MSASPAFEELTDRRLLRRAVTSYRMISVAPGRLYYRQQLGSRVNNFPAKLPIHCHRKRNLTIEKRNCHHPLSSGAAAPGKYARRSSRYYRYSVSFVGSAFRWRRRYVLICALAAFPARDGERVFALFVANPKTIRLYRKGTRLSPRPVGIIRVAWHQACRFASEMADIVLLRQELARGFGMRRVFVLGSGFSRAISNGLSEADKMPTLTGLSEAVLANLDRKGQGLLPGRESPVANDFEQWLNYLIESPPWLTTSEQHRNRAAFFEVSQALRDVLLERQKATVR